MYDTPLTITQILALLPAAPARLAGLTADLPPAALLGPPAPGGWSARDMGECTHSAHLRACADMWGKYILRILNEDQPLIKAVSPRTWVRKTGYLQQEFQPLLAAYTAQRSGLLAVLEPLPPAAWSRPATVTGAGKARQRTVYTYAQWLANHELSHFGQMERIAAAVRVALGLPHGSV